MTTTATTAPTLHDKILTSLDRAVDAVGTFFTDPASPESPDPRKISAGMLVLKRAFEMHDAITAKQDEFQDDEAFFDALISEKELEKALAERGYRKVTTPDSDPMANDTSFGEPHNATDHPASDAHAAGSIPPMPSNASAPLSAAVPRTPDHGSTLNAPPRDTQNRHGRTSQNLNSADRMSCNTANPGSPHYRQPVFPADTTSASALSNESPSGFKPNGLDFNATGSSIPGLQTASRPPPRTPAARP